MINRESKMTERKRRDVANNIIQVYQRFYSAIDILSKDVSEENYKSIYRVYEEKINSLKVSLNEYNMLTSDVNNLLQELVINIKEHNSQECFQNMNKLEKELVQQIKRE